MARGETYEEFVKKFERKDLPKTTDDCYTPAELWSVVLEYVSEHYGITPDQIIRPFYPGGDYTAEDYSSGVVVDNPPFSIIKQILTHYLRNGVPFFLFCPALTPPIYNDIPLNSYKIIEACVSAEYSNGAKVKTSFVTNLEDGGIRTDRELRDKIEQLYKKPSRTKNLPAPWIQVSKLTRKNLEYNITPEDVEEYNSHIPNIYGPVIKLKKDKYNNIIEQINKIDNAREI